MAFCDLHLHSTASDGTLTPKELVERAKSLGLATIGLTDHDTVEGCEEAVAHGKEIGIRVIPGVEMSTELRGREIHILGYGVNVHDQALLALLAGMRDDRTTRMVKIIERLRQCGFDISLDEVYAQSQGGAIGRPHLARVMLEKGIVRSVVQAFDDYLGPGKPAYVPRSKLLPVEAISYLNRARAVTVLAHPGLIADEQTVWDVITVGIMGIEAYHSDHSGAQVESYRSLAGRFGLLVTGGSDFHGPMVKGAQMGRPRVPETLAHELIRAIETVQSRTSQ